MSVSKYTINIKVMEKNAPDPEVPITNFNLEDNNADNYSDASFKNHNFSNNLIRKKFCQSTYFLLFIQIFIAATFAYANDFINSFYPYPLCMFLLIFEGIIILAINISASFCFHCRLYFPMNFFVLLIYTFVEGCFLGSLSFVAEIKVVKYLT